MATDMTIATTIRNQIGHRALYMLGAKNIAGTANSLSFKIAKNNSKANYINITLNSMDNYDIEFIRIFKFNREVIKKFENVDAENMHEIIRDTTGLDLHI
jgi:hypothetical protein